jgi:hypothetical protein
MAKNNIYFEDGSFFRIHIPSCQTDITLFFLNINIALSLEGDVLEVFKTD